MPTNDLLSRRNYKLMAVLTTTSPLHITQPGEFRKKLDGKLAKAGDGFPFMRTTMMSVANRPSVMRAAYEPNRLVESDGGDDQQDQNTSEAAAGFGPFTEVPVIPPNTVRGMMRRRAAEEVSKALLARNEKLSVGAYNVLLCGAATGNPDSADPSVDELLRSARHPYFGTFGGGPRMLRSRLRVDTALAITDVSVPYLDAHFELANNGADPWRLLETGWKRRNDDLYMLVGCEEHRRIVENYEQAVGAHQDVIAQNKADKKEELADAKRNLASLSAREFVKIGTHFALTLELVDGTEAQAGLLLSSLLGFVQQNRIGGGGALGCGRFLLQNICLEEDGERHILARMTPDDKGSVFVGRFAELRDSWGAAANNVSAGEIEDFARPSGKTPAKKAGKGAAAAVQSPLVPAEGN